MSQIQDNSPVKLSNVSVATTISGNERLMATRVSVGTSVAKTVAIEINDLIDVVSAAITTSTGVIAGTYGTTGIIPQLTIDVFGRITSAVGVSVSLQNTITKVSCSTSSFTASTVGDTLNIHGGTGLDAAVIAGVLTMTMKDTAVSAGTYGDTGTVPQLIIDQQGRITGATRVSVSLQNTITQVSCSTSTFVATTPNDKLNIRGGTGIDTAITGGILTMTLKNTAASAGTYGDASNIPQFTVDAQGRITAIARVSVSTASPQNTITIVSCSTSTFTASGPGSTLNIRGGTGLDAAITGGILTLAMISSGVSAGTYGSSGTVPQLVVNAQGILTAVNRVSVAGGISVVTKQAFLTSGTYTPTSGMVYCIVEAVGGGSGGGGAVGSAIITTSGGGGGAGYYCRSVLTAAQIGASKTVTIGAGGAGGANTGGNGSAGGATSLGTLVVANSGGVGQGSSTTTPGQWGGVGGAGGLAGDLIVEGGWGTSGIGGSITTISPQGGNGGRSILGAGPSGYSLAPAGGQNGQAASANTGAGGAGGCSGSTTGRTGGAGGSGIIFITEFCTS